MGYALRLLGRFELSSPSGETIDIAAKKNQVLIALLALAGGEPVSRSRVCEVLWGDRDETLARNSLRQALTALRKTFCDQGSIPFVVSDTGVTIDSNAVSADVWQFVDAGCDDTAPVGLWRGMFLDGLSIAGAACENGRAAAGTEKPPGVVACFAIDRHRILREHRGSVKKGPMMLAAVETVTKADPVWAVPTPQFARCRTGNRR